MESNNYPSNLRNFSLNNLATVIPEIFNMMTEIVIYHDTENNILWVNNAAARMLSRKPEQLIGRKCHEVLFSRSVHCKNCHVLKSISTGKPRKGKNTSYGDRYYNICAYPVKDSSGKIEGVLEILTDTSDAIEAGIKAEKTEDKYRALYRSSLDGVYISAPDGRCVDANPALLKMLGYADGNDLTSIKLPKKDLKDFNEGEKTIETKLRRKNGSLLDVEISLNIITDNGRSKYYQGIVRDITERKKLDRHLNFLSFHDSLTRLYNRAYFEEEIKRLNTKRQFPITLILGDINNLKLINDTFGHNYGDKLIKAAAKFLKKYFRKEDIVARWGGDEFVSVLPKTGREDAENIIKRIEEWCNGRLISEKIPISISFGVTTAQERIKSTETLLKEAEDNMYRKKLLGKKEAYTSFMSSIEKELHDSGIEKKEFIEKIKYLALKLGRELKLSPEKLEDLSPLAEVYDIGKVAINKNLLFKKEKLTKKEFDEIKRHAEISYNILKYNASLSRITEEALYHHEWWDGSGYPQGLKGKEIPVLSRIIAIVEAYMVMITGTEYKKPVSPETAINEIKRGSGTQFDPVLVERFIWKERL